jgi:hypothetical protein
MSVTSSLKLKTPSLTLFCARRCSGKSHLAAYLLYEMAKAKNFDYVLVISPTDFTGFWKDKVGAVNVREDFSEAWLTDLLEHQKDSVRKKSKKNKCLLILDDCLSSANFHDNMFLKLSTAGRHYNLTVWAMFQHMFHIPTSMRVNADYIFFLNNLSQKMCEAITKEYPSKKFKNWKELSAWSKTALENYGVMLVDNTGPDAMIYKIRAPEKLPNYKLKMKM